MSNEIRIDTDQVALVSQTIHRLNLERNRKLTELHNEIMKLSNTWKGENATTALSEFHTLTATYFQKYFENIYMYTEFLRKNIAQAYTETERNARNLAAAFDD